MNILYVGDIMGRPGRETLKKILPKLKSAQGVDVVIAQGENLSHGKGLKPEHIKEVREAGVDFLTGGNWTLHRPETHSLLSDPVSPVVRPANYSQDTPGQKYKVLDTPFGRILMASFLGQIVGYAEHEVENPLHVVDQILEETKHEKFAARIVNFHGDFSSEKVVFGRYLDGKVSAVIGDHWHVPTADARVLPGGTAHITDVGMVGSLDSCLGVQTDIIIKRWHTGQPSRNELETEGVMQFNAVLIAVNPRTGLADSIKQINKFL